MSFPQEKMKSSRRLNSASSGCSFRDLDTEFLTTQAKIWIENVLGKIYDEEETVADLLADGEILYEISKLIGKLMENKFGVKVDSSVSEAHHFGKQSGKYLPYSYIDAFLKICKKMGLTGIDLFSPPDAVEKRDVRRVCLCIRALSKKARSKDLDVPDFDLVTTDLLSMSPDMVDILQKYLKQDMYGISIRSVDLDPETNKGSGKINQPFFVCPPEASNEESDVAESEFKSAVFEISNSFWEENSVANIGSHSGSPRSSQSAIYGYSSKSSTAGGFSARDSLSDVNASLIPENDNYQQNGECFRIKDAFLTDALNIYLEKSGHLTVNNSTKIKDPPPPLSNEGNFFNEYPTDEVDSIKSPVNGEVENLALVAVSYDTNPAIVSDIHINNVNYHNVKELESEFLTTDYASRGKLNAVDIDRVNMPVGILHMLNANVPKTEGTDFDCLKVDPLNAINVPFSVFKVNNNPHNRSGTVNGVYAHSSSAQVSDDFIERTVDDIEVNLKYVPKEWDVDVRSTDIPKIGSLGASHENVLKGESMDSYCANLPQPLDIYTDKKESFHANNVMDCYIHEPQRKHLEIDFIHEVKVEPDFGDIPQTVIADIGIANVPNRDSIDSMPSAMESFLATADSSLVADFTSHTSYEECECSTLKYVSKGTEQGELNNMDVYTKFLQREEFIGDPTNASDLESLDDEPMYTQNADSTFHDNSFSPEVNFKDHQSVNKKKLDIDGGVILKEESVDMVGTSVHIPKIDGADIALQAEVEEKHFVTWNSLKPNNVADGSVKLLKSEAVVESATNRKTVDINCAIDTDKDNAVSAGNNFVAYNIYNHQNALKTDIVEAERDMSVKISDIISVFVTVEDNFVNHVGNGLDRDNVNHASTNMLKSEIHIVESVANKKTGDINFAYVCAEDGILRAVNGLEAELVNDHKNISKSDNVDGDSINVLKPAVVAFDSPANMQMGKINHAVTIEEICVANVGNVNDSSKEVRKLETSNICCVQNMKTDETNCADVTEEDCIVNDDNRFSADNFDHDSKYVLKSDFGVDNALNMKIGHVNFLDVPKPKSAVNTLNGSEKDVTNHLEKVIQTETIFDSGVNMRTKGSNHGVVIGEASIINDWNGSEAVNIEYGCANVMNSKSIDIESAIDVQMVDIVCSVVIAKDCTACTANGFEARHVVEDTCSMLQSLTVNFDSALGMKTGDINCPLETELEGIVNPRNKLEAHNVDENGRNVLQLDSDSSKNVKTNDISSEIMANDDNIVDAGNVLLEKDNANGSINMLKLETAGVENVHIKTGYINCPVSEAECAAHVGNMLKSAEINNDFIIMFKPDTVDVDNAAYMKAGDINFPPVTEVESALPVDSELQTDEVKDDTKNLLESDIFCADNPSNGKTGDTNSKVMIKDDTVINDSNWIEPNNIDHGSGKTLKPDTAFDNAGNLKAGKNIKAVKSNISKISNMDIVKSGFYKGDHISSDYCPDRKLKPSETPEKKSLIASDSRNQPQPSADCEHGNEYKIQQKETEKRSLGKDESEEHKHTRKAHRKRLWISVLTGGIAFGVTMGAVQLWKRKQKEFEIKEGDTLSDISKRAGKSSWNELVIMNSETKNPDLIYPGQRIKLK